MKRFVFSMSALKATRSMPLTMTVDLTSVMALPRLLLLTMST